MKTKTNSWSQAILIGLAAFGLYFCMYAFRKPFAVGKFEGLEIWGIDYKIVIIILQIIGYALSKFIGIKFISELNPTHRPLYILGCIGFGGLALLGFALVPAPYNALFMFLNGLPLGLIWGLVFSYLEGRTTTEIMAVLLSSSFIVASGMVKSVGKWLIEAFAISEFWMPILTGSMFILPLLIFVRILHSSSPPSEEDKLQRKERQPMTSKDRKDLFWALAPGLIVLIAIYIAITIFRDFRDNFAIEIWESLGVTGNAAVFTQSELPISVIVLLIYGMFVFVKDNTKAFLGMNHLIGAGILIIGLTNLALDKQWMSSPMLWTILTGSGLYLAYFAFNSMLFDRLVANLSFNSNAGFLIYLADAFGYLGTVGMLLFKEFFQQDVSYLNFMINLGYIIAVLGVLGYVFSHFYFKRAMLKYSRG